MNGTGRLVLPVNEAFYYYYSPEKNDGKIKWVHCTGDTAQSFAIVDVCDLANRGEEASRAKSGAIQVLFKD